MYDPLPVLCVHAHCVIIIIILIPWFDDTFHDSFLSKNIQLNTYTLVQPWNEATWTVPVVSKLEKDFPITCINLYSLLVHLLWLLTVWRRKEISLQNWRQRLRLELKSMLIETNLAIYMYLFIIVLIKGWIAEWLCLCMPPSSPHLCNDVIINLMMSLSGDDQVFGGNGEHSEEHPC